MKAKKLIAGILAGTMVLSSAVTASAATSTKTIGTGTYNCTWWDTSTFAPGVPLSDKTTTITFDNKANGSANYNSASYVVYYSDDGKIYSTNADDTAGQKQHYKEYFVATCDVRGWETFGQTEVTWGSGEDAGWAIPNDALKALGYDFLGQGPREESTWETWVAANQAGSKGEISAYISNKKAYVTYTLGSITTKAPNCYTKSVATIPLTTDKVYLAVIGDNTQITNLQYSVSTISVDDVSASLSKTSYTYNGSKHVPTLTIKDAEGKTTKFTGSKTTTNFQVKYSNASSKKAGTYTVTITGRGDYEGYSKALNYTINQKSQKIKINKKTSLSKSYKVSTLKKSKKTVTVKVTGAQTKLVVSNSKPQYVKGVVSGKKVKITIKKNTPKGTYKVRVNAKSSTNYKASTQRVITIKVTK